MIHLEPFDRQDYDRLISWIASEEEMVQFSGPVFTWPVTHEQLEIYRKTPNRLIYRVVEVESNEVIGHAELNHIDTKNKSARICRILIGEERYRNRGFGKAIVRALIHIGFDDLRLHRLDLGVYDFNQPAIKCYQDCGLEIEGLLRENIRVGNSYWSTYNMSILNKR
ncbi:GNAT family N-acetyltransferase [Parabacteroides sp. FAFU027]|uniref:GNAT family N-acetyltransferase n=1 Tax=Parabacteroides sp. FAFU027 TaxID=2922715 RepID=UPI001FAFA27C|nr:GNAT family protein [Parabacteroides sp. FAFU027]